MLVPVNHLLSEVQMLYTVEIPKMDTERKAYNSQPTTKEAYILIKIRYIIYIYPPENRTNTLKLTYLACPNRSTTFDNCD